MHAWRCMLSDSRFHFGVWLVHSCRWREETVQQQQVLLRCPGRFKHAPSSCSCICQLPLHLNHGEHVVPHAGYPAGPPPATIGIWRTSKPVGSLSPTGQTPATDPTTSHHAYRNDAMQAELALLASPHGQPLCEDLLCGQHWSDC
jgi:hypothetical protein